MPGKEYPTDVNAQGVIDVSAWQKSVWDLDRLCETYAAKSSIRFRTPGYSSIGNTGSFCRIQ